jgi:hypothetical protein
MKDPSIINLINQKLINKIEHAIRKKCLESGDSDIMFTSLEGDDFDEDRYKKAYL